MPLGLLGPVPALAKAGLKFPRLGRDDRQAGDSATGRVHSISDPKTSKGTMAPENDKRSSKSAIAGGAGGHRGALADPIGIRGHKIEACGRKGAIRVANRCRDGFAGRAGSFGNSSAAVASSLARIARSPRLVMRRLCPLSPSRRHAGNEPRDWISSTRHTNLLPLRPGWLEARAGAQPRSAATTATGCQTRPGGR